MKRLISLILLFGFLLSGCSMGERIKEPVTFYYIRENYQDDMGDVVKVAVKKIDMAASKGLLHKNNAAHKKSNLVVRMNKAAK